METHLQFLFYQLQSFSFTGTSEFMLLLKAEWSRSFTKRNSVHYKKRDDHYAFTLHAKKELKWILNPSVKTSCVKSPNFNWATQALSMNKWICFYLNWAAFASA